MEIRVLKYFLTVAEIGNITKAANSMHLTQPTLSRQLQDLERELGQKLFVRGSKSVTLTPEGMVSGDIFIGAGETKTIKLIADVMKTLQKKYQKIKFHIVSGDSEDLSEKLDKGILDFCIFIEPFVPDKYNYINLSEKDTWGILLRQDDPLAKKESIKVEDIINLPILISRQAIKKSFENNPILDWFGDNFDKMHIAGTYNLLYNAAIMTENEIGYALGLDRLIADTLNSPLTFRPLNPKLQVCVSIAWKKNQVFSKAAKLFLDEMNVKFN